MSDPIPTLIYPPGLSEPVIIPRSRPEPVLTPRQLSEIRLPESKPSSRLARAVHGAICAGVVAGQRRRAQRRPALPPLPPVEEWPPGAFDRLMDAVREVPPGRLARLRWRLHITVTRAEVVRYVRAAVGR